MTRAWVVCVGLAGSLGLSGCEDVGASSAAVIYGNDDRTEIHAVPDGVHRLAAETAVVMQTDADFLDRSNPDDIRITYEGTLGETEGLCTDVAFYDQPDPGYCSGTLIDERHVMTAGHCVETADDCSPQYPWVFGYYYESEGVFARITADDVYECVSRVVHRNDLEGDYAIIELDRPVVGRTPATLRIDPEPVPNGTGLTLIGHPNGIPMKVAGDASVQDFDGRELYADLDAFFGNSGSGVWDDAGQVVGILVAGSPADYQPRRGGTEECYELVELTTGDDFEFVQPTYLPLALFCETGVDSPACGAVAPLPDGGPPSDGGMGGRRDDGGCSAAGSGGPGALSLVFLAVLFRRRQRGVST